MIAIRYGTIEEAGQRVDRAPTVNPDSNPTRDDPKPRRYCKRWRIERTNAWWENSAMWWFVTITACEFAKRLFKSPTSRSFCGGCRMIPIWRFRGPLTLMTRLFRPKIRGGLCCATRKYSPEHAGSKYLSGSSGSGSKALAVLRPVGLGVRITWRADGLPIQDDQ